MRSQKSATVPDATLAGKHGRLSSRAGKWKPKPNSRVLFVHAPYREPNFTELCATGAPNAPVRASLLR